MGTLVVSLLYRPIKRSSQGTLARQSSGRFYTNLWLQSEDLASASWTKNAATISATNIAAPTGVLSADTLLADVGVGTLPRFANTSLVTITGQKYTASFFAKAETHTFVQLYLNNQATDWVNFTLSGLGTVNQNGGATGVITPYSNSWYRCAVTYIAGGADRRPFVLLSVSGTATRAQAWNPAGTESMSFWGMQFETGSIATTYIPTTTVAVTREEPY
jgi:hypothetical protein